MSPGHGRSKGSQACGAEGQGPALSVLGAWSVCSPSASANRPALEDRTGPDPLMRVASPPKVTITQRLTPSGSRDVPHGECHLCSLGPWLLTPGQPTMQPKAGPATWTQFHGRCWDLLLGDILGFPVPTAGCRGRSTRGDAWNTHLGGGGGNERWGAGWC